MQASIVLPIRNDARTLVPLIMSLIENTPENAFDVVIVDRGSTDETTSILEGLGGDVTIIREDANCSLAAAINKGVSTATGSTIVLASPATRFTAKWLETLLGALDSGDIAAPRTDSVDLDVIAFRKSWFVAIDESAHDATAVSEIVSRTERIAEQLPPVVPPPPVAQPTLNIPTDLIGPETGAAMAEIIQAGLNGAGIGELPPRAAELLRQRLAAEEERRLLLLARAGRDVCWTDEHEIEPLVTIRIPTFNRSAELMEVALPSALNQTYENIEIVVVGDCTDEATERAMAGLNNPRVRFVNLPVPSTYPQTDWERWLMVGSPPMNLAMDLARGSWIAPADDDDVMMPDHVEVLLNEARTRRLEFVWSKTLMETPDGWQIVGGEPLGPGATTHGAVMWSSGLRFMKMSLTNWKLNQPGDENMWWRMHQIGVRMGFLDRVTYKYYASALTQERIQEGAGA